MDRDRVTTPEFVDHGAPKLDDNGGYPSDAAAYRAVLASTQPRDRRVVVPRVGRRSAERRRRDRRPVHRAGRGERSFAHVHRSPRSARPTSPNNGVLFGIDGRATISSARAAVANRAYLDVRDPARVRRRLRRALPRQRRQGRDAARRRAGRHGPAATVLPADAHATSRSGSSSASPGIGVIMVRAVRERRRQVGVLRALGFQAAAVRAAFVVESAFVAVEGVLIGTVLALVCAWSITLSDAFGSSLAFRVPFGAIGLLVVGTFVCALLATAAPARSAAADPPRGRAPTRRLTPEDPASSDGTATSATVTSNRCRPMAGKPAPRGGFLPTRRGLGQSGCGRASRARRGGSRRTGRGLRRRGWRPPRAPRGVDVVERAVGFAEQR